MKSVFSVILTAACVCGLLTGCGDSAPAKKETKVVRMVTEATFPPYEYREGEKIVGIDPEIVGEVCNALGYKLVIEDMKFDSVILAVQTGKAEIAASGITVTEERRKKIDFTIPYVTAAQVIVVPMSSKISKVEELKGKRIGVQHGTTGDLYVAKHIGKPERYDNGALAVAALMANKLDVVVLDSEPSKFHVALHPKELKILPFALTSEEYAFAISKNNKELLNAFNKELYKMRQSGRLQQILDKYLAPKKK